MIPTGNAKFALVIAEYPKNMHGEPDTIKWQRFLGGAISPFPQNKSAQKIHDNIWLICLSDDMKFLSELFVRAGGEGIPLRILFLDEPPDWIKYPPDAEKEPLH